MGYTEVTIIYDGALESEETFKGFDTAELKAYLEAQKKEASTGEGITEIYVLEHEHDESEEDCTCVQYLQSHHPMWISSAHA